MTRTGLVRTSSGLSPAHVALIKMLAAKAVHEYLAEVEPGEAMQTTDELDEDQA
jgi:hypothetical protein